MTLSLGETDLEVECDVGRDDDYSVESVLWLHRVCGKLVYTEILPRLTVAAQVELQEQYRRKDLYDSETALLDRKCEA